MDVAVKLLQDLSTIVAEAFLSARAMPKSGGKRQIVGLVKERALTPQGQWELACLPTHPLLRRGNGCNHAGRACSRGNFLRSEISLNCPGRRP